MKKLPVAYNDTSIDCIKLVHVGKFSRAKLVRFKIISRLSSALRTFVLPEVCAVKHAVVFMSHFILQSRAYDSMKDVVLQKGIDIIRTVLTCIGVLTARTCVDIFADIFIAFNKKYPAELVSWMKMLEMTAFPTTLVTNAEKEQFMKKIIRYIFGRLRFILNFNRVFSFQISRREKVNKRLVQGHIREFSAQCRGLVEKL